MSAESTYANGLLMRGDGSTR